jgi:alpha-glucosidase (family GH31 glycosyl hydrolase)
VDFDTPIHKINVHVRGGFIIPMQIPGPNLVLGRANPLVLLVALSPSGNASGSLFWDDGDSMGMSDVIIARSFGNRMRAII